MHRRLSIGPGHFVTIRRPMAAVALISMISLLSPRLAKAQEAPAGPEPPMPTPRVLVKHAPLGIAAQSPDGRWYAGANQNELYLIDRETLSTTWQLTIPDQLGSMAFAPDGRWLAVSGKSHIYRIDLEAGKWKVLIPYTTGTITFHPNKPLIASFGYLAIPAKDDKHHALYSDTNLPVPIETVATDPLSRTTLKPDENKLQIQKPVGDPVFVSHPDGPLSLSVFDYEKRKWQRVMQTGIWRGGPPHFIGEKLHVYGNGGDVQSAAQRSYAVDAWLDLETGKAAINSAGTGRRGGFGPEAHVIHPYTKPDYIEPLAKARAQEREPWQAIAQSIQPPPYRDDPYRNPQSEHFILREAKDGSIRIGLSAPSYLETKQRQRILQVAGVLTIQPDGQITTSPVYDAETIAFSMGRMVAFTTQHDQNRVAVVDVFTGKTLAALQRKPPDQNQLEPAWRFHQAGWLTSDKVDKTLSLYDGSDIDKPKWTYTPPADTWALYFKAESPDGRRLAYLQERRQPSPQDPRATLDTFHLLIFDAQTGEILSTIETDGHPHSQGVSFNDRGDQVMLVKRSNIVTYQADTGQQISSTSRTKRVPLDLLQLPDGINLQDQFIDVHLTPHTLPYRLVSTTLFNTRRVTALGRPAWLFDTEAGWSHLVDEQTSKHLAVYWTGKRLTNTRNLPPPHCIPALDGQVIVVSRPHANGYDLIDLKTMQTILTLNIVTAEDTIGWVAHTPDGWWDASPGAETFITLYQGLDPLTAQAQKQRHRPDKIKAVITRYVEQ